MNNGWNDNPSQDEQGVAKAQGAELERADEQAASNDNQTRCVCLIQPEQWPFVAQQDGQGTGRVEPGIETKQGVIIAGQDCQHSDYRDEHQPGQVLAGEPAALPGVFDDENQEAGDMNITTSIWVCAQTNFSPKSTVERLSA